MGEIVIYGVPGSPYVRKVLLTCLEKGAPHRLQALGMGENRQPAYLAERQPFGRIPAVEHDGFRLYETQAIMRYVDEAFDGPSLQPKDVKARARMNQVMNVVDCYVMPSMSSGIGWNRIVAPKFGMPVSEDAVKAAIEPSKTALKALEQLLDNNPYMAGQELSLADLMLIPHIDLLRASPEGAEIIKGSPMLAWRDRMLGRASVQATDMAKMMADVAA